MSRLTRRVQQIERGQAGDGASRIFFTTMEELPEDEGAAFLADERERLGIGDGDVHIVTIYEARK